MRYGKAPPVEMQKMIKILEALKWTTFCQKRGPRRRKSKEKEGETTKKNMK